MKDDVATSSLSPDRRDGKRILKFVGMDTEDGAGFLRQVGEITRTDTDVTLVGGNGESSGSASDVAD